MNSIIFEYKNGEVKLSKFIPNRDQDNKIRLLCRIFGYLYYPHHDRKYRNAPIITNDDGSRFGYLQVHKAIKMNCRQIIGIMFQGQAKNIHLDKDELLEYNELHDKIVVEVFPNQYAQIPLSILRTPEVQYYDIVDAIYFVFKTHVRNLSLDYFFYQRELRLLNDQPDSEITDEVRRRTAKLFRIPAFEQ